MSLDALVRSVERLKSSEVSELVSEKTREFKELGKRENENWFSELCFCILTANSTAKLGLKIQRELGNGFLILPKEELRSRLKELGHRFYNRRAEFIVSTRKFSEIKDIITKFPAAQRAREWLVENVDGIGYKEASHFLRNVGIDGLAILDRHILTIIREHGLVKKVPRTPTRRRYLEIEKKLKVLAKKVNLSLAELDLYLWYMKTGRVMK
ncbi:MAG: N-glycosylase [Hadesarchaea archaeon DG-33-1]|nr:MAG: N-glycosylase [Hadesarchaea archaeon DG-33-1]